jgi:hypothetical protein
MVKRILVGSEGGSEPQGAKAMAVDLLRKKAIDAAWDLATGGYFNCVRVQSPSHVITPQEQAAFDAMLDQEGRNFNVVRRNDSGHYSGVDGTPIS